MTQPTQNLVGKLLPNSSSPIYDSLYPLGDRGAASSDGFDNFESGDFSGATGFSWVGGAQSSIVTATPRSGGTGTKSLQMRYPVGAHMSEQPFAMPVSYNDLYVRFWLKVPSNYYHNADEPSNNKLLALWMDEYSAIGDGGATAVWEYWSVGSGNSEVAVHWQGGGEGDQPHIQSTYFINTSDQGRWMELTFRAKKSSTRTTYDGILQLWRRWEGEGTRTLLHNVTTALIPAPVSAAVATGWKEGYVMGWSNPTYDAQTDFLIDDFQINEGAFE